MDRVPFNPDELNVVGEFPSTTGLTPGSPKLNTPVTPRENYAAALAGELPLWIPKGGDTTFISPQVVPDNVARVFVYERQFLKDEEKVGGLDMFGIDWEYVPLVGGSIVRPENPTIEDINDWKNLVTFPDIDAWDWEGSAKANEELINSEQGMIVWQLNGMFERLISWMDFENAVMALIDEDQKEAVLEVFDKLADLYIELVKKYKKYYNMTTFYFHDDWGSQRAPFFSLATVREMLVPSLKKIVDFCHSEGIFVEFHCCGSNEMLVPGMIDIGFDVWNGMSNINDKPRIWELYGDGIIIGFSTGDLGLTRDSSDEDVVATATAFVEKYGPTYAEKPVTVSGTALFNNTIYELSRKMFSPAE